MSVTIKLIAESTGLSIPTVGNILGKAAHRYNPETRRRVLQAASDLGYRPNASARAMRNKTLGCAALILSRSQQQTLSFIPDGLLDGLDDELATHNMHLTVSRLTDEELSSPAFLPKVLREYMADGMIVNCTHRIPEPMLELIHAHHAPAVWTNAKLADDCVYPDDFGAARAATERLLSLGHRRIAMVQLMDPTGWSGTFEQNRPRMHYSVFDRAAGYGQAMREAGLNPQVLTHERFIPPPEQVETCHALLKSADRPTAVLAYARHEASAVVCAARLLGWTVPADLSLVVFSPRDPDTLGYSVTAAAIPTQEMGRRAVQMLLEKIKTPGTARAPVPLPYGLQTSQTIGPPRTKGAGSRRR